MEIFTEGITFLYLPNPAPCAESEFVNIKKKPRIDLKESIPPGWESILGLLKRFTIRALEF